MEYLHNTSVLFMSLSRILFTPLILIIHDTNHYDVGLDRRITGERPDSDGRLEKVYDEDWWPQRERGLIYIGSRRSLDILYERSGEW